MLLQARVLVSSVAMAIALVGAGFEASGPVPGLALEVMRVWVFAGAMATAVVGAGSGAFGPASGLALVVARVRALRAVMAKGAVDAGVRSAATGEVGVGLWLVAVVKGAVVGV
ncbi:hypothetical protein [Winogradskya humida]|uniref:hypothetical protein n=1 Tax=Winogradskya humida TaxID=113566 RepID=UPI001940CBC6|nr:hypothetical protein [Actinoplanes humidus]